MNKKSDTPPCDKVLKEASHHVLYELWMFIRCSELSRQAEILDQAIRNALIEARAIHLRSLSHFFTSDTGQKGDILARNYFRNSKEWKKPKRGKKLGEDHVRANKMIAHITEERASEKNDRATRPSWELKGESYEEIIRYAKCWLKNVGDTLIHDCDFCKRTRELVETLELEMHNPTPKS